MTAWPQRRIGPRAHPFVTRYFLLPPRAESSENPSKWPVAIWLHHVQRSDARRALHDHPFSFVSLVIWGGYSEEVASLDAGWPFTSFIERRFGSIVFRPAEFLHRVHAYKGGAWTLVIRFRRRRKWGYQTRQGWMRHEIYHLEQQFISQEQWHE